MIVKNVEKKENNTALFTVQADAAEFEKAVNGAYLKNKSSIYIPGFRKGKAPRAVVEGMYGSEVFYQDALDELAPAAFEKGLEESGLRMVGSPAISDVKVNDDKSADFTFEIKLYPEVTLGQYKGLSAEKPVVDVDESEVERELEKQRKQNARQISVDDRAAQMGDVVNIDFDGFLDGERFDGGKAEGYSLELGSNSFVPGFEDQVAGMQIGEEKDLNITFPVDYAENLAGKDVVFKVKLNSISVPELPELDDEFAKDVSEFDTLEEYKADVRAKLVKNADEQADNSFRNLVMKKAVDSMSADVPDVMIKDRGSVRPDLRGGDLLRRRPRGGRGDRDAQHPQRDLSRHEPRDRAALSRAFARSHRRQPRYRHPLSEPYGDQGRRALRGHRCGLGARQGQP